jgi:NADH:ubiquinone oxidoreductase subunit F (NADH-binding)
VVANAETVAHAALVVRHGAAWFRSIGSESTPGSALVTLQGDVDGAPIVLEIVGPTTLASVVSTFAPSWQAALTGGFAGSWIDADAAHHVIVDPGSMRAQGLTLGCGLIAVLGPDRCPLGETARLVDWLVGQRAGQCGSCRTGLPLAAETVHRVAEGSVRLSRAQGALARLEHSLAGSGLCSLPDAVLAMAQSGLLTFADEARAHRRGRCCAAGSPRDPWLATHGLLGRHEEEGD